MTHKRISDQINTIRVAAQKASVSSETALAFLRSAGIIPEANQVVSTSHKRSATAKLETSSHQHPTAVAASSKTNGVRASQSRAAHYPAAKRSK